ncbi:MAG: hypothetical protein KAX30_07845 [Candidatus Atribacteria bacterium]|nr:hypothetical protein [Candidatus Atribacteria bacterium]
MTVAKRGPHTKFRAVEIAGESDYDFQSYDLGDSHSDTALDLAGSSLTIWGLDGSCSVKFDSDVNPSIPLQPLSWPAMVVFERDFTNIFLTNAIQAGKTLKIYVGEK